jgi:16S rRNA (uracil1498-N3)-methyltransferase
VGPASAGAAAHAFVDDLDAPTLSPADRHHLERVLRLRSGAPITVSDGRGGWRRCRFGKELGPDGVVNRMTRPHPEIAVAFALTKGEKPERVVQQLTEAGVDRILPFVADRTVVRWDEGRVSRHESRFEAVARAAAMQSRRVWLPEVCPMSDFPAVARLPGAARAEIGGRPPTLDHPVVLVGPEGGWSDAERAIDLPVVALSGQVLRAETAAIAAGVLLTALRVSLVTPGGANNTERGILGHSE